MLKLTVINLFYSRKKKEETKIFTCWMCNLTLENNFQFIEYNINHKKHLLFNKPIACSVCKTLCKNEKRMIKHQLKHKKKNY